jgi:hypothetical protein
MSRFAMHNLVSSFATAMLLFAAPAVARAQSWVYLTDVPDYDWHAGCFGTASGNLMGYWDRHGLPDIYTGPTGGGLAPLNSFGGNVGIRSLWVSQAGVDGRPLNQFGHMDDYYVEYESIAQDPYVTAGRPEHQADCVGDFIGLNQRKWTSQGLNGECIGNIDAYSFVFWDTNGNRRINFTPTNIAGAWIPDIQSGFKAFARYRNYDVDVFTQLNDHRVGIAGRGFTYEHLKAEINAGYPVCFFLQPVNEIYRTNIPGKTPVGNTNRYNPEIHGVMAYGYAENVSEIGANKGVILRTSWASGDNVIVEWGSSWLGLWPPRGAIGFRPRPKIKKVERKGESVTISWDGPSSQRHDAIQGNTTDTHRYQLERATSLNPPNFGAFGQSTTSRTITFSDSGAETVFYRVVLLGTPP